MEKSAKSRALSFELLAIVAILAAIGLIIIYTSSAIPAYHKFQDSLYFFRKQAMIAGIGFAGILIIWHLPFRFFEIMTLPVVAVSLGLLAMTFIPQFNVEANGAARWIGMGPIVFQPAELAKLALALFLSRNLGRVNFNITSFWKGIVPNLFVLGLFAVLLMLQPDFGSMMLLFSMTFFLLFAAGLEFKYISIVGGAGLIGVVAAVWLAPYRLKRLVSFLDPWENIRGGGFQIIQSYVGFQNGGFWGLGLGESKQKLYFLPEAHTDFILSVIGEELGLIGVLLVVFCFGYLSYLGFSIAKMQTLKHRAYLAYALTFLISFQAMLNIGVAMGLLPTKGIPLPFVSSGASSLLVFLIVAGLLAKLGKQSV
jgi:cell division protein FtsW